MAKVKETSIFVKIAALALVVFFVILIVNLQLEYNELLSVRDEKQADLESLKDEKEQLEKKANAEMDDDYIIETAKEKLNLRMPEEIIFYNDLFNTNGN